MRKINFLTKLYKEGKLQFVEPSENVKTAYLQRSEESLSSAKALLKIGNLKDSAALAYYSMYHCLLALLFRTGIKCENHAAAIIILKEVFGKDNRKISKAKEERVDKQYYVDFKVTEKEVQDSIAIAEEFIADIRDFIEKLKQEDTNQYQKKAHDIVLP